MARKLSNKKEKKDSPAIRYFFHAFAIGLIVLTVLILYWYSINLISLDDANTYTSITLSMMFSIVVFSYLIAKGNSVKGVIRMLGLSRDKLNWQAFWNGIKLFLIIFVLEILTSVISQATGIQLPTNVASVLGGEPIYFLVFATFIVPFNEEIFFSSFFVRPMSSLPIKSATRFPFLMNDFAFESV